MSQAEWFVVAAGNTLMVAVRRAGRWVPDTLKVLPVDPGSPSSLLAACDTLAREWPSDTAWKGGVRVLLDDGWLAGCRLPWSDGLGRADAAEAFARTQLEAAGFDVQADDTVRIDDGPYRAPRRAVAYGAGLLAALGRVAQAAGGPLRSVRPLSDAAWCHAARSHSTPSDAASSGPRDRAITSTGERPPCTTSTAPGSHTTSGAPAGTWRCRAAWRQAASDNGRTDRSGPPAAWATRPSAASRPAP